MNINSRFIIVKHDAKKARLHYDLRFVMPNSKNWISFAVRKGVPTNPGQKVLAVRTHDHTEEEALFLGTIESGYGAGKLTKYDGGRCIILKYTSSHMTIDFKGSKVKGIYHLINTGLFDKSSKYKNQQFILFKGKSLNEWMGLAYVLPPGKDDDVDEEYIDGPKLPWSKHKITVQNGRQTVVAAEQIYEMLKKYIE